MTFSRKNAGRAYVCLISGQPIPNLLPLLQDQPHRAVFIVTPQMQGQASRLEKVVKEHGIAVSTQKIDTAYDYNNIVNFCEQLLEKEEDELVLNVTGGTKITALAAFQAFFFSNKSSKIIYCDTEHDRLLQLAPKNKEFPLATGLLTVKDYLSCYGLPKSCGGIPPVGYGERRSYLSALATLFAQNENLLSKLNSALESGGPHKQFANISLNSLGNGAERLFTLLEKCGVAARTGSNNLNIPTKEALFFCKGGWLEEFVYREIKALPISGLDLLMNVKVK